MIVNTIRQFVINSLKKFYQNGVWLFGEGRNSAVLNSSGNEANGDYAVAEGQATTASGYASHAEGNSTIANNPTEHAEGKYNISIDGVTQHTVGIGDDNQPKNAHIITTDGKHFIPGVGGYEGTETSLVGKSDLSTVINNKVDKVLMEKTYDPYTVLANDKVKGWIYFLNVIPTSDNYFQPWSIRYRLYINTTENYTQGKYDCYVSTAGTVLNYSVWNDFYSASYRPIYTHVVTFYNNATKYNDRETYPIKIGARVQSSRNPTTLARTYRIEVYEINGCTVTFNDSIQTYDSFYDNNHYGTDSEIVAYSTGLWETGDQNTVPYLYYEYYTNYLIHDTTTPLYRYKIVGFDENNKIIPVTITDRTSTIQNPLTACPVPMKVSRGLGYYATTTNITTATQRTASGTLYRGATTSNWQAYNFNELVPINSLIYLCGDYNSITDDFTLDTTEQSSFYAIAPDTATNQSQYFTTGKYYWLVGFTGSTLTGNTAYSALYLDHPLYYFDGCQLIPARADITKEYSMDETFTHMKLSDKINFDYVGFKNIKGNSLVWNQLATNTKMTIIGATTTYADGYTSAILTNENSQVRMTAGFEQKGFNPGEKVMTLSYFPVYQVENAPFNKIRNSVLWNITQSQSAVETIGNSTVFGNCVATIMTIKSNVNYNDTIGFYLDLNNQTAFQHTDADHFTVSYNIFNLTRIFGAGKEPSTVEEFESLYNLPYYPNNNGEIISNKTEQVKIIGFNQWDEVAEVGSIDITTGANDNTVSNRLRTKNAIPVLPLTTYYFRNPVFSAGNNIAMRYYDADGNYIGSYDADNTIVGIGNKTFKTPAGCYLVRSVLPVVYGITYNNDICINLSNPSRNGKYKPYTETTINIPITTLTGVPEGGSTSETIFPEGMRSAGDTYDYLIVDSDGWIRKANVVCGKVADLGAFTWQVATENVFFVPTNTSIIPVKPHTNPNALYDDILCPFAVTNIYNQITNGRYGIAVYTSGTNVYIRIRDPRLNGKTAGEVKSILSGVPLIYELATPITYILDTPIKLSDYVAEQGGTLWQIPDGVDLNGTPVTAPLRTEIKYTELSTKDLIKSMINS